MLIEYHFKSSSPETAAVRFISNLAEELRGAKPSALEVMGNRLTLNAGLFRFVSNWNILIAVTSAVVSAEPMADAVKVQFDARLTQLISFCCFGTVFFFATAICIGMPRPGFFMIPVLVWGWLFGMNYLLTRVRLQSLVQRVARPLSD